MPNDLILNAAHPAGRTFLTFSRDGNIIYTGGRDSLVRVWKAESGADEEPDIALDADEPITALATDNDGWLSGSEDSQVRRYSKTATDMNALITRTNAVPVRNVSVDPKGRRVAVTSDEPCVKLIDLNDTTQIKLLEGHKRSVRSATWHPTEPLLTTCGSDGKVIVWDLSEEEPKIEKIIEGIIPEVFDTESDTFGHECVAVWHPSGSYFLIAGIAYEIAVILRSTWSKISSFTNDDCIGVVTAMAISVNGVYLASACKSGIFVWSTTNKRVIVRYPIPESTTVHQLSFSPSYNILAWTDSSGNLSRWPGVIPVSAPSPIQPAPLAGVSVLTHRQATPPYGLNDRPADAERCIDDEGEGDGLEEDADWIIDDLGTGMIDKGEKDSDAMGLREMVSVTKAQPAFQPGATPFRNRRRYLSYNNIGLVEVVDQDIHQIVDVSFHDQTTRKNYHFTDSCKYDMASVGERGVIYASPPEAGHPARIYYKPYSTWATHSEWTYILTPKERVVAIAAGGEPPTHALRMPQEADINGNGYVAVATDAGIVRFFTGGGLQKGPVWAVDGDIVSMVAGRDYLFLVHREGGTSLDGNQNLKYTLRTSDTFRVMHTGRLPINRGHTLKWIGVSDEGVPVIYDSSERFMILEHYRFTAQGSWAVLLDAKTLERRKGKDESYWPISVSKSIMTCIIMKGREDYPGFPRPLPQEIPMNMPYLEMEGVEAQKGERIARETIFLDYIRDSLEGGTLTTEQVSKSELELDKELIQIIQLACKSDRLQRALDAVKLLHHTASLDLAIRVADFYHLIGLQEKISTIRQARENADRLHNERTRRQEWREAAKFVPQSPDIYTGVGNSTPKLFQDVRPTPSVFRPRLAAARPSTEPSPFSEKPSVHGMDESDSSRMLMEKSPLLLEKRKRDGTEGLESQDSTLEVVSTSKRQATNYTSVKANPFAKSSEDSLGGSGSKPNLFVRKTDCTKALGKSNSFFEKVNVAENEAEKTYAKKRKKQVMKQTTLFGLPPPDTSSRRSPESEASETLVDSRKNSVAGQFQAEEQEKDPKKNGNADMDDDEGERISASAEVAQAVTTADGDTQTEEELHDEEAIVWPPSPPSAKGHL